MVSLTLSPTTFVMMLSESQIIPNILLRRPCSLNSVISVILWAVGLLGDRVAEGSCFTVACVVHTAGQKILMRRRLPNHRLVGSASQLYQQLTLGMFMPSRMANIMNKADRLQFVCNLIVTKS